jgi:hypothetical protein
VHARAVISSSTITMKNPSALTCERIFAFYLVGVEQSTCDFFSNHFTLRACANRGVAYVSTSD